MSSPVELTLACPLILSVACRLPIFKLLSAWSESPDPLLVKLLVVSLGLPLHLLDNNVILFRGKNV